MGEENLLSRAGFKKMPCLNRIRSNCDAIYVLGNCWKGESSHQAVGGAPQLDCGGIARDSCTGSEEEAESSAEATAIPG